MKKQMSCSSWNRITQLLFFFPAFVLALPEGEKVTSGEATFERIDAHTLHIQTEDKTIIHYKHFNIGEKETVRFHQPHSKAVVLNRVKGSDPSQLLGRMASNGKVILVNPNGIFFGPHSEVNVGSLIASTLHISDENFKKGNYRFELEEGAKNSFIENQGFLSVQEGGCLALLAPHIVQKGVISAHAGQVAFLAAPIVTLDFTGDGLVRFAVEGELESTTIEQIGIISALQGNVFLHMRAADRLIRSVVNMDGFVPGEKIVKENGVIRITSSSRIESKTLEVAGKNLDIAGSIETHEKLKLVAADTLRLHGLKGSLDAELFAKTVVTAGSIQVRQLHMEAKEVYYIGGDIETLNQEIRFTAPVFFTASDIRISTGATGSNIIFEEAVNSGPYLLPINLTLSAGRGDILFTKAVGSLCPLKTLSIESGASVSLHALIAENVIQHSASGVTTFREGLKLSGTQWGLALNGASFNFLGSYEGGSISIHHTGLLQIGNKATLQVKGAFLEEGSGSVIAAGKIQATDNVSFGSGVSFMEDVEILGSGMDQSVIFHSTLDGPGGLLVKGGSVAFEQDIGTLHSLSHLDVVAKKSVLIGNVAGITDSLKIDAGEEIVFKGSQVRAKLHKYQAGSAFSLPSGQLTRFVADSHTGSSIIFEGPRMALSKGSHLVIETLNGEIRCPSLSLQAPQNITLNAGKGPIFFRGLEGEEKMDHLHVVGGKISLAGPLKADRMTFHAENAVSIKGDLTVGKGSLIFDGPVLCEGPVTRLSVTGIGDIAFLSTLEGSGDLFLTAPEGMIRFDGVVGGGQKQFASLTAVGRVIDQNNSVRATGPIVYTGNIYLGHKIATTGNAIVFNGPVIRDGIDAATITTQKGAFNYKLQGDVIFNGPIDADIPLRSLSINAGMGSVYFKDTIGAKIPLQNLTVDGRNITFASVGGSLPGVTQLLYAPAEETICYRGAVFHVGSLMAKSKVHEVKYLGTSSFVASPQAEGIESQKKLAFSGGPITLAEGSHLSMNSKRANISFVGIEGSKQEKVSLTAEGCDISVGSIGNGIDRINIKAEDIWIQDVITGHYVSLQASQNILYANKSKGLLKSGSDIILQAHGGKIGTMSEPIHVEVVGKIRLGAKELAHVEGKCYDFTVHILPGQRPETTIFNEFEYQDPLPISFLKDEMETLSLTPDLQTNGKRDSIDPSAIAPRKVGVYVLK